MNTERTTAALARALVRLLPRALRDEFGPDMVQAAVDRHRHGGEPWWRLWPSLVGDTTVTTFRLRWEAPMFPTRSVLAGGAFAVAVLALLSGDLIVGLAGVAVLAVVVRVIVRNRPDAPLLDTPPRWSRHWRLWIVAGVTLCTVSVGTIVAINVAHIPEPWWAFVMLTMISGLGALGTGAALSLELRRHQIFA